MEILIFEIHNLFSLIIINTLLYYDVNSWGTRKHWIYYFVQEYSACGTRRVKSIDAYLYIVLSVTIFMCVSLIEIIWILISISLKWFFLRVQPIIIFVQVLGCCHQATSRYMHEPGPTYIWDTLVGLEIFILLDKCLYLHTVEYMLGIRFCQILHFNKLLVEMNT